MKKFFATLLLTAATLTAPAQAASLHEHPTVAVLPYVNKAAVSKEISAPQASVVSEFVQEQLIDSHRFTLLEREQIKAVLSEIALQFGGSVNENTIVQIGNLSGASFLIAGSITGLSTKESNLSYDHSLKGGAGFNKMTVVANVTMRFIDVETGEIVIAASGVGESARTNAEFTLKRTSEDNYETTSIDESGMETPMEDTDVSVMTQTLKIGSHSFSLVQVQNALYKAVVDAIYNKNFGLLAKMDGRAKRRKV